MGKTKKYVLTGLMTALVFILTFIIKIPIPFTSGYIHLGDSMIYISVIVLGPFFGAFASGVGSMFADIAGGYAQYAVPTLIIKSVMALIMGLVLSGKTKKSSIISITASISVWVAFTGGTLLYLKNQVRNSGLDSIVKMIAGSNADSTAIQQTTKTVNNLPVYFTVGTAAMILIFAIIAWFISKRNEKRIFNNNAIVGMTTAGICMVMGYFIADSLLYTPIAAILTIPMNMIQFFGGIIAAGIFLPAVGNVKV
jgi:uncharacterized membrane protein